MQEHDTSDNDPTSETRDHSKGTNGPVPSDNVDNNNENRCIPYPTQIRKLELMPSKSNPADTKYRNVLPQCKLQLLTTLLPSYIHHCCLYHIYVGLDLILWFPSMGVYRQVEGD